MKILHLCTTDDGGAGTAVLRLHDSLCKIGFISHIIVFNKTTKRIDVTDITRNNLECFLIKVKRKIWHEVNKKFNKRLVDKYDFFNYSEEKNYIKNNHLIKQLPFIPDIVIVHFITHFMNIRNIYELQKYTKAKIVFTMMDMAPLTGGCHFAWDCDGFKRICGSCPAISSVKKNDISNKSILYKQKYLSLFDFKMIVHTEHTRIQASMSSLYKENKIQKILLPIDEEIFKPNSKERIRKELKIPSTKKVIFIGSQHLNFERKGFHYFVNALNLLSTQLTESEKKDLLILTAGKDDISSFLPFENIYLGVLKGNQDLVRAYQVADIFACPSVEDSGPMMINEAIMCGTPVISFEMGVSLDLVKYPETGYRAQLKDVYDFARGLKILLFGEDSDSLLKKMSMNCRTLALNNYSTQVISNKWETFIKSL